MNLFNTTVFGSRIVSGNSTPILTKKNPVKIGNIVLDSHGEKFTLLNHNFWNTAKREISSAKISTGEKFLGTNDGINNLKFKMGITGDLKIIIDEIKREFFAKNLVLWENTTGELKKYEVLWSNPHSAFPDREGSDIDYIEASFEFEVLDSYSWDHKTTSEAYFSVTDKEIYNEVENTGTAPTDSSLWLSIQEAQNCTEIIWENLDKNELVKIVGNFEAGDIIEFDSEKNLITINGSEVEDYLGVMPDKLESGKNKMKVTFVSDSIKTDMVFKFIRRGR